MPVIRNITSRVFFGIKTDTGGFGNLNQFVNLVRLLFGHLYYLAISFYGVVVWLCQTVSSWVLVFDDRYRNILIYSNAKVNMKENIDLYISQYTAYQSIVKCVNIII